MMVLPFKSIALAIIGLAGVFCAHTYPPYPTKSLGIYLLVTDDYAGDPVYHTPGNWQPQLYPYQQNAANVLYFTFVNPKTMPAVPVAFQNLAQTRGTNAQGAVKPNQVILFSIGGCGFSKKMEMWPWLHTIAAAEAMADQVALWPDQYGCDGIDLDLEGNEIGNNRTMANIFISFVKRLRQQNPSIYITQPISAWPHPDTAVDMINTVGWTIQGKNQGYLQNIGIMWYKDNPDSFWWASRYNVNTAAAHYLIKVFVPNTDIVGGIAGNAVSRTILEKAARTMTDGFGGMMVWYASVLRNGAKAYSYCETPGPSCEDASLNPSTWPDWEKAAQRMAPVVLSPPGSTVPEWCNSVVTNIASKRSVVKPGKTYEVIYTVNIPKFVPSITFNFVVTVPSGMFMEKASSSRKLVPEVTRLPDDCDYSESEVESYTTWSNVTHQAGKDTSQRFVLKIRVNGDATPPLLGLNAGFDYFDDALDSLCSLQYYTELVQLP